MHSNWDANEGSASAGTDSAPAKIRLTAITDAIMRSICVKKSTSPSMTQDELVKWFASTNHIKVSQATISNKLQKSAEFLSNVSTNEETRRHRVVLYLALERDLYEWILGNQAIMNITSELIRGKAARLMTLLYTDVPMPRFFEWLAGKNQVRHGIKSFHRLGESGSVDPSVFESSLASIRNRLKLFEPRNIFNMDKTGLFYKMEADHSLATRMLEWRN